MRIGLGHDTHRLGDGGPLRLGGVDLPHDRHAIGHSDADALLHAITDALLGAAALGDIGEWFPDTDQGNHGRDSAEMLSRVYDQVRQTGWRIVNLDCIVFAQRPKIGPHRDAIRRRIAEILALSVDQVGVKAKTGENVGPVGREEAIMAECVVLLRPASELLVREPAAATEVVADTQPTINSDPAEGAGAEMDELDSERWSS